MLTNLPPDLYNDRRLKLTSKLLPKQAFVAAPTTWMKVEPSEVIGSDTQLIYGESLKAYESNDGWMLCKADIDGYVGWVKRKDLMLGASKPDMKVDALSTFLYPEADLKAPPIMQLPLGASITSTGEVEVRGTRYTLTDKGALISDHLVPISRFAHDFVTVAERLMNVPYLWAGRSAFGLDCSALVQISLAAANKIALRDTDMQQQTLGEEIELTTDLSGLQRGDLIFWKGHVAVMQNAKTLVHANGHTMTVFSENAHDAVTRIAHLYQKPTSARRLSA